jgi:hypothetical protein
MLVAGHGYRNLDPSSLPLLGMTPELPLLGMTTNRLPLLGMTTG